MHDKSARQHDPTAARRSRVTPVFWCDPCQPPSVATCHMTPHEHLSATSDKTNHVSVPGWQQLSASERDSRYVQSAPEVATSQHLSTSETCSRFRSHLASDTCCGHLAETLRTWLRNVPASSATSLPALRNVLRSLYDGSADPWAAPRPLRDRKPDTVRSDSAA